MSDYIPIGNDPQYYFLREDARGLRGLGSVVLCQGPMRRAIAWFSMAEVESLHAHLGFILEAHSRAKEEATDEV